MVFNVSVIELVIKTASHSSIYDELYKKEFYY